MGSLCNLSDGTIITGSKSGNKNLASWCGISVKDTNPSNPL